MRDHYYQERHRLQYGDNFEVSVFFPLGRYLVRHIGRHQCPLCIELNSLAMVFVINRKHCIASEVTCVWASFDTNVELFGRARRKEFVWKATTGLKDREVKNKYKIFLVLIMIGMMMTMMVMMVMMMMMKPGIKAKCASVFRKVGKYVWRVEKAHLRILLFFNAF